MIQEIAKKYPYSTEHVKTVLEQNNYNKEKAEAYIKCELIAEYYGSHKAAERIFL